MSNFEVANERLVATPNGEVSSIGSVCTYVDKGFQIDRQLKASPHVWSGVIVDLFHGHLMP